MKKNIIIIDDCKELAECIQTILLDLNYSVIISNTLAILNQIEILNSAALIILDLYLYNDSTHSLSFIRQTKHKLPIIIISGHPQVASIANREDVPYLSKPFDITSLVQLVKQTI